MRAIIAFFVLLGTLALGAGQTVHYCSEEGGCDYTGALSASGNGAAGNVAIKADATDAVMYVSANGSDTNDGLSWGTAKATIQAATDALPACTYPGYAAQSFDHCGKVIVGGGDFPDTITIDSPHVDIWGAGRGVTILDPTITTGCVVNWTSTPFNSSPQQTSTGGLHDITIDGGNASAGTCGIHGYDIGGLVLDRVQVNNFSGSGSSGLWEDATTQFDERWEANLRCGNDAVCWKVTGNRTGFSATTFGYGTYEIWCNPAAGGTCLTSTGQAGDPTTVEFSRITLIGNMASGDTDFTLDGNSTWDHNVLDLHFEGETTSYTIASGGVFEGIGSTSYGGTASVSGTYQVMSGGFGYLWGPDGSATNAAYSFSAHTNSGFYWDGSAPSVSQSGSESAHFGAGHLDTAAPLICLSGISTNSCLSSPGTGYTWTLPGATGTVALQGGTCAMSSGTTCTATVSYGTHCIAQDTAAIVSGRCSISGTTLTVTAASSNSDAWAWSIVN